jgi:hypothetical protein
VITTLDCDGDETPPPWRWGLWLAEYYRTGEFPSTMGIALETILNSLRKQYPETFCGQSREDTAQEVLLKTLQAIAHCKKLRKVRDEWNDAQLWGYVKAIVEDKIRLQRRNNYPELFAMLRRIRNLAKKKLKLVDEDQRTFIPIDWALSEREWQMEEGLQARLLDVAVFDDKIGNKIPGKMIEKAVRTLFDAAGRPVSLDMLVEHCLRVLQIREPINYSFDFSIFLEGLQPMSHGLDTGAPHDMGMTRNSFPVMETRAEKEMKEWLENRIRPLSTTDHLVPIYFRICRNMTLKETTQSYRKTLGLRNVVLETVRTRLIAATKLMRKERQCAPWFPETAEDQDAFRNLLADCIQARLMAAGITIDNANDAEQTPCGWRLDRVCV